MAAPTPESVFDRRLAADPGAPLVTFYDDSSGERVELSAKNTANWVAKTYSLLVDSLGLGPGDTAFVRLPLHWLAVPVLFGCWYAGLEVVSRPGASVAFADAESLAALPARPADEVFAVSLLSMARPATPPPGAEDFALSARPMPDAWGGVQAQAGPAEPGYDGMSRAELMQAAATSAAALGLAPGARLLWAGEPDWVPALLAPLSVDGSSVLVRNPEPGGLDAKARAERVTVRH